MDNLPEEPAFEEIKRKATELYFRDRSELPPDERCCETLKSQPSLNSSYWTKARKILMCQIQDKGQEASSRTDELSVLLSPREASRMIGFSYKTLWRWWKEGKIRAVRFPSRRLRYYRSDIEQLLGKTTDKTENSQ